MEKRRGEGQQQPGSIAGLIIGGPCPPVLERGERLEGHRHELCRVPAIEVCQESNAAGIVIMQRVVERRLDGPQGRRRHSSSLPERVLVQG